MKGAIISALLLGLIIGRATGEVTQWSLVVIALVAWLLGLVVGLSVRDR